MTQWEPVIGLEVHAQLKTRTKLFCGCRNTFGEEPNTQTCPVCLGHPGALPVINRRAVELAVKLGLAVGATVHERSVFARKNYFYPDLPKGYQISQFDKPVCEGGQVPVGIGEKARTFRLTRIHMEEDAGKLLHEGVPAGTSAVDFNRACVPLVEIVGEPELRSAKEAAEYLRSLHSIVVYLDVCDGNMQEGSFRCDANVSVRPKGETKLGTRVELKNLNSFLFVEKAIEYEIKRQVREIEAGGKVVQETRRYDADRGETYSMRSKEEAHDYRYFPEPDLVPLLLPAELVERVRKTLPELAGAKAARFMAMGLSEYDATVLVSDAATSRYFEDVLAKGADAKQAANWITQNLFGLMNKDGAAIGEVKVTPDALASLIALIASGTISNSQAKEMVLPELYRDGGDPSAIVKSRGLAQVSDSGALAKIADDVIAANTELVAKFRGGDQRAFGSLMGEARKMSGGNANMKLLTQLLREKLG